MANRRKFTDDQVKEIKSAPDGGRTALAEKFQNEYGIRLTKATVFDIQMGRSYKDLYPELTRLPKYRQVRITNVDTGDNVEVVQNDGNITQAVDEKKDDSDGVNPTPATHGDADDWTEPEEEDECWGKIDDEEGKTENQEVA